MINKKTSVSIVIPVYGAEATLSDLVRDLLRELNQLENAHEIILVEDCGGDNSWSKIVKLAKQHPCVRGIKLSRNFGQHNALLCGIREAQHSVIVTMDDDGQHPPSSIASLLKEIGQGSDLVYGTPIRESHGLIRNLASIVTKKTLKTFLGITFADKVSAYRAFNRGLIRAFDQFASPVVNIDILLSWATENVTSVQVARPFRAEGRSGYTASKLINHAFNMITGFSIMPLRIASFVGLFFAFFGLLVLFYILIGYAINGSAVPGFAFTGCLISIFSGVQLLTIGLIGEYVGRIHVNSMSRPPYLSCEKIGFDSNDI